LVKLAEIVNTVVSPPFFRGPLYAVPDERRLGGTRRRTEDCTRYLAGSRSDSAGSGTCEEGDQVLPI
jgi:hypothetical protein